MTIKMDETRRLIEFRGKVASCDDWNLPVGTSGWVYGHYFRELDGDVVRSYIFACPSRWEVMEDSVGEFTGLYDAAGIKIYEWDIIAVNGKSYEVCYSHGMYIAVPVDLIEYGVGVPLSYLIGGMDARVVGNATDMGYVVKKVEDRK